MRLPQLPRLVWLARASAGFSSVMALLLAGWSAACGADTAAESAAMEQRLGDAVKFLSSDALEGRGVGTKGLDKAADFIAEEFRKIGLKTDIYGDSPFQKFKMPAAAELGDREKNSIVLTGPPEKDGAAPRKIELKLDENYRPLAISDSGTFNVPLVFAGYGITAKEQGYDDYAGLDVKGKVVVLLRKEPQQGNPHSKFNGANPTEHATYRRKLINAAEHGAVGILLVNDNFEQVKTSKTAQESYLKGMTDLAAANEAFRKLENPTPAQFAAFRAEAGKYIEKIQEANKALSAGFDNLLSFQAAGEAPQGKSLPIVFCTRAVVDPILKNSLGKDLTTLEDEIDQDLKPRSAELKGWQVSGSVQVNRREVEVKNVIGVLEGEGPHADETVIIGAHYDHVGMGGANSLAPWTVAVHNGADDNASGTSALVEVARALASRQQKPKRRIVFIAFTGEERGLIGSAHYVRDPRFPLEKTVAMLNMDMVGRLSDNKLTVFGTGTAASFDKLTDELGKKYEFQTSKKPEGMGPSDHASFYPKKIPVIHLFTGTHSDYHRPSDDFEKINVPGMRRVVLWMIDFAVMVADADARPEYREVKGTVAHGGPRPLFGAAFDTSENPKGCLIEEVVPDSPAEKGGVKAGDVIVRINETRINSSEEFQSTLALLKGGAKITVGVIRDKKEIALEVTLGQPPRPRPYVGSIPDFGQDKPGYAISGVAPGSPADTAGMKGGDIIVKLGDNKVEGLDDFDAALRKFKAGDTVDIVVKRGDKEIPLKIKLGEPRG